jgi:membrane dipeptidase
MQRRTFLGTPIGAYLASPQLAPPNEVIERSRATALRLLAPSDRDLQHGLELHADSLVVESYGFMPRGAADGDLIRTAAEAGASQIELQDLAEDHEMTRYVTHAGERKEYLDAWRAAGVTCIMQNAGEEGSDPMRLMKRLARYTYVTHHLRDHVSQAVAPDDILTAKKQKRHCVTMTGNGVPITQAWVSVQDELRYLPVFFQLGVRMMHLTYNRRNMIGDGCGEPANAGLSDFGRAVVAEMNRLGVIVDVAHSGWRTSLEGAQASKKPMVASHTACAALHQHIRAKPDEVLRAVCDTGGLAGVCCIPEFLGRTQDIRAVLDHIDHIAKKFGVDHAAIGTDVAYRSRNASAESRKIPRRRERIRWEALWPEGSRGGGTPEQVASMAWTNWPLFTVGLVQRGYRDDDIRKIIGGNVMRVLRANFDGVKI